MEKIITVGLGEVLWDIFDDGKKFGGAPTNFAFHGHALGADGAIVSSVGDDALGREILDHIDDLEIDRKFITIDSEYPTGTVSIELDSDGQPSYVIAENTAWDFIPSSSELLAFAGEVDAVCFGSLAQRSKVSSKTIRQFLQATPPDCIRLFDINIRQSYYSIEIIEAMLGFANVFKLNKDELSVVAGLFELTGSETDILQTIVERFSLKLVVLTKGAGGSILLTSDNKSFLPAEPVEVVDTVGAGDAFSAAVAIGMLRGFDLARIHSFANKLAAFICTQAGAAVRLPDEMLGDFNK